MILFLDFDGVLHPADVAVEKDENGKRLPVLQLPGKLFQWAPLLETALAPYHDVQIVLSTKWVWWFGLPFCKAALPESLAAKVVGATWEGSWQMPEGWVYWDRCRQVRHHAAGYGLEDWFAIDDDDRGLASSDRGQWVITAPWLGVSEARAIREIEAKLEAFR